MQQAWTVRLIAAGALALVPLAGGAADPPAGDDFTFRRIAVPQPDHAGPRITVQIDPAEQARRLAVAPRPQSADPSEAPERPLDGFWALVDPAMPPDPSRFATGLRALAIAPPAGVTPPRLQALQAIAEAHGPTILRATIGTRVSPALVLAVISVESAGRVDALSHKGAQGLMQLIPATAERFGVADPLDPAANIAGGVAYLDWLMDHFDRDAVLALAAYNAGEGAVRRAGGVPDFSETRAYVPKVLAAWEVARGLCLTPPELPGDGCVFAVGAPRAAAARP